MNNAPILYRLTPFDLAGHRLRVQMTIPQPAPEGQRLRLPAWIPGSYLLRDFARHVLTLHAHSGGQTVAVRKADSHTWQCAPCEHTLVIDYTVYAWDLSVRGAHVDENHAFFNGTSVFLQAQGQAHKPCLLTLEAPPNTVDNALANHQNWTVHTSLPAAPGAKMNAAGFGTYIAPDYDALIDHPVEMGTPASLCFDVGGVTHELVFTGVTPKLDLPRIARDIAKICAAQMDLFAPGETPAGAVPFLDSAQKYVFLVMVTEDGYGGLEHRASTALMTSRRSLPTLGQAATPDYTTFLGLVSHEYFHTWHVKRIKPAAFAPYDLWRENHTRLLWVFEGFTAYYDDLMLLRSACITLDEYLKLLARTISQVQAGSGRFKQSLADSSFDAWTRFYKQDENAANAIVSYYAKGSLVALGLDLLIRQQTGNQRSLDDVMRLLWQRFGKDFYRGQPQGLAEDALPALVQQATGVDVTDFITRYVEGCEDVPLVGLLANQGIALRWQAEHTAPTLDARTRSRHGQTTLAAVQEGGAAHHAGLSAGDVLVALDGLRISHEDSLKHLLAAYQPGDCVTLHTFRRDELRTCRLTLSAPAASHSVLERLQS